jgi:hypothetical protein
MTSINILKSVWIAQAYSQAAITGNITGLNDGGGAAVECWREALPVDSNVIVPLQHPQMEPCDISGITCLCYRVDIIEA